MKKQGAQLFETPNGTVKCDSLWSVSQDGNNLQAIVAMGKA